MHVEMELPCLLLDLFAFTPVLSPWMSFGGLSIFSIHPLFVFYGT
jgi:hypothetical protein